MLQMADLNEVRSSNRTDEGGREVVPLHDCQTKKTNTCSSLQLSGFEYNGIDVLFLSF